MAGPPDVASVMTGMTSDLESTRKLTIYHLQHLVADASFADAFVQAGGVTVLKRTVLEESGNALAYALGCLTRLLEMDLGWEVIGADLIEHVRTMPKRLRAASSLSFFFPLSSSFSFLPSPFSFRFSVFVLSHSQTSDSL